jgi:hypothetical protein
VLVRSTDIEEQRPSQSQEEFQVEDITDRPYSPRDKERIEVVDAVTSTAGQKIKTLESLDISLPFIPDAVPTVEDILGKFPKLRYVNHDVRYAAKFLDLVKECYLINTWEVAPLGRQC